MEALEQAPQTANLTAAGHELLADWLALSKNVRKLDLIA